MPGSKMKYLNEIASFLQISDFLSFLAKKQFLAKIIINILLIPKHFSDNEDKW
jgi:hypothetical protein